MNLLDRFVLQHFQVSVLHVELLQSSAESAACEAKVELNLAPRLLQADAADKPPAYQVSARLTCQGGGPGPKPIPAFKARVGLDFIYRQFTGEPLDFAQFTAHHASLTRQIYPLLQHELRGLLGRMGLEQIHLPYDLVARQQDNAGQAIQLSASVH